MSDLLAEYRALVEYGDPGSVAVYVEGLLTQRNLLRAALVGLIGADGPDELAQIEAVIRAMPAPAADKATSIDAIHALIATAPAGYARR